MVQASTKRLGVGSFAVLAGLLLFLTAFLIYPVAFILTQTFRDEGHFSVSVFFSVFQNPFLLRCMINSLTIAGLVTFLSIVISLPVAHVFTRYSLRGRGLMFVLLLAPLILPPFVGAIGIKQIFGRFGSINLILDHLGLIPLNHSIDFFGQGGAWGVVVIQVLHLYPIALLNIMATMSHVDPAMREAALNLGARPWRVFRTVTMPLIRPGIFAGGIIVFISSFTDVGTPLVFGMRHVIPIQIFDRIGDTHVDPSGYALVVLVLILTSGLFIISKNYVAAKEATLQTRGSSQEARGVLSGFQKYMVYGGIFLLGFVSVLPHISVIAASFAHRWFFSILPTEWTMAHYAELINLPLARDGIRNSLLFASASAGIDLILGLGCAFLLTRRKFAGQFALDVLVMLPLAIPGLVLAFGYLMGFNWKDSWINPRINPAYLLIIAYSVRRLPFMVRAAVTGFTQMHPAYEEASANLGASPFRTLRKITIPLISGHLVAGTILTFAFAVLEVSDSLILAMKTESYPITKAIYTLLGRIDASAGFVASAMGVLGMVILALCLWAASRIVGKRTSELFKM